MAFTIGTTKVLNLPEQVEENVKNIEALNSELNTKQDAGTAVNDGNLKSKTEAYDSLSLKSVSTENLTNAGDFINEGNLTNAGTIDVEGKATFGSDAEVDGKLTINSADDLVIKDGSTFGTQSIDDFKDQYYANAFRFRLAGVSANPYRFQSISAMFPDIGNATSIEGFMLNFIPNASGIYTTAEFPAFTADSVDITSAFGDCGLSTIVFNGGNFSYAWQPFGGSQITVIVANGTNYIPNANDFFQNVNGLVEVGEFDMSKTVSANNIFLGDSSLKRVRCKHWKVSFDISSSTAFEESDLVEIIGNLDTVTTPQTLTMGATNLAKLTQDEILVATGKGWTLA